MQVLDPLPQRFRSKRVSGIGTKHREIGVKGRLLTSGEASTP